jgi:hypothetical protein
MRIIGCDLHARQQTVAMLDTFTGEVVKMTRIRRKIRNDRENILANSHVLTAYLEQSKSIHITRKGLPDAAALPVTCLKSKRPLRT